MKNLARIVGLIVLIIVARMGYQVAMKQKDRIDNLDDLNVMCRSMESESLSLDCQQALGKQFGDCFEEQYTVDGGSDIETIARCVNERSGVEYFTEEERRPGED